MGRISESVRARRQLLIALAAASLGIVCGYDLSNIAGALLFITDDFDLTIPAGAAHHDGGDRADLRRSVRRRARQCDRAQEVDDAGGGRLCDIRVGGRRLGSMPLLVTARLLLGMTVGLSAVVVPVFIAESAPARVRGAMLVHIRWRPCWASSAAISPDFVLADSHSWRWMLGLAAVPAAAGLFHYCADARHRAVVPVQKPG